MKKKFASILMGGGYRAEHQAVFEVEGCGAFGEEKARELITLTEGKLAIGFSVHFPEQDDLFNRFFSYKAKRDPGKNSGSLFYIDNCTLYLRLAEISSIIGRRISSFMPSKCIIS